MGGLARGIATSTPSISTTLINTLSSSSNSSSNALTSSQKSWISNYSNRSKVTSLNNYLKQNQYSSWAYQQAKGFALSVIGVWMSSPNAVVNFDDRVINSLTNPCANNIFTELTTEMLKKDILNKFMNRPDGTQLTFAESILKLFNDSNGINYNIKNGYLSSSNGQTKKTTTTISDSYLKNATQLSIARTIIHEMVHAYMNARYYNTTEFDSLDFQQKLVDYAKKNGYGSDMYRIHHEFMGQYVNAMAISLVSWDEKYGTGGVYVKDSKGNNVLDSNKEPILNWKYYRIMAFGGLYYKDSNGNQIETDSFKALVTNQSDRDKIKNIIINEQDGNYNSKGSKCN